MFIAYKLVNLNQKGTQLDHEHCIIVDCVRQFFNIDGDSQ